MFPCRPAVGLIPDILIPPRVAHVVHIALGDGTGPLLLAADEIVRNAKRLSPPDSLKLEDNVVD